MTLIRLGWAAVLLMAGPGLAAGGRIELVFSQKTGLGPQWKDRGWSVTRRVEAGAPVALDLSNNGGWIVARPELTGTWEVLSFKLKAPPEWGNFLEVRVDSRRAEMFPRVLLKPEYQAPLADGWVQVRIPLRALNPGGVPFEQLVFRAVAKVGSTPVLLDEILILEDDSAVPAAQPAAGGPRASMVTLDCNDKPKPISSRIYGLGYDGQDEPKKPQQWEMGITARRWGGNPSSRFNWQIGHAWNTANDSFFRNVNLSGSSGDAFEAFLADNTGHEVESVLTVPTLGWVAKDTSSYAFPVSLLGPQQAVWEENPDIGNGVKPDGSPIAPGPLTQTRTSVPAPAAFVGRWVKAIRERDKKRGRSVEMYILDNEPSLWNSTHRDVHPSPLTYDELLERTVSYAREIRKVDPEAVIAGPADGGWQSLFFSAADLEGSNDRASHGDVPLLPWWLREVAKAEKKHSLRLIDVLDVHWYPQFDGAGVGSRGATEPEASARRIRSVRSLWDPTYEDESWIKDKVALLPRLRKWITENHPNPPLEIAIGAWQFGAEEHMSGGLATAAALGVFGREGVLAAFRAGVPAAGSPTFWAFRAYRNYDGKGSRFLDLSVPVTSQSAQVEAFASRNAGGDKAVAILLNEDPANPVEVTVEAGSCGTVLGRRTFVFTGKHTGLDDLGPGAGAPAKQVLPPYSLTVVELKLKPPR